MSAAERQGRRSVYVVSRLWPQRSGRTIGGQRGRAQTAGQMGATSSGLLTCLGRSSAAQPDCGQFQWWISTMPGLALSLVVISVGAFGDQLRDHLDPRSAGTG